MAAYAATIALDFPRTERVGNTALGILIGVCTLSNYNTTQAEITGITGRFKVDGIVRVIGDMSTAGYVTRWNAASKAFEAFVSDSVDGGVLVEAATDDNVGSFGFIAIGQL